MNAFLGGYCIFTLLPTGLVTHCGVKWLATGQQHAAKIAPFTNMKPQTVAPRKLAKLALTNLTGPLGCDGQEVCPKHLQSFDSHVQMFSTGSLPDGYVRSI